MAWRRPQRGVVDVTSGFMCKPATKNNKKYDDEIQVTVELVFQNTFQKVENSDSDADGALLLVGKLLV